MRGVSNKHCLLTFFICAENVVLREQPDLGSYCLQYKLPKMRENSSVISVCCISLKCISDYFHHGSKPNLGPFCLRYNRPLVKSA